MKAIATPMDATVGCLWAEGVAETRYCFSGRVSGSSAYSVQLEAAVLSC